MFKGVVRSRTVALVTCWRRPAPAGSSTCTLVPEEHTLAGNLDDVPLPPAVTVVVAPDITPTSEKRTLYVPGKRCPNEYVPSDAVVVVIGCPAASSTGLPDESRRVTVAPGTAVEPPVTVAVPVSVEPHWDADAADTETVVEDAVRLVVTLDALVYVPKPVVVNEPPESTGTGPVPAGHCASAVGFRHSCGDSPIAVNVARPDAGEPVALGIDTWKTGDCPDSPTSSVLRSAAPLVSGNVATVFPLFRTATDPFVYVLLAGDVSVNVPQPPIAEELLQPSRGMTVLTPKLILVGDCEHVPPVEPLNVPKRPKSFAYQMQPGLSGSSAIE